MDQNLQQEYKVAKRKSAKPMLWFSMISMTMMFAGLTSAYLVSRKRTDWVAFDLPDAFYTSTIVIILSSITFYLAKYFIKRDNRNMTTAMLVSTLVLGLAFVYFQFEGFSQMYNSGFVAAGAQSTVKSSFIYGITIAHIAHIAAGIVVVLVVLFNHLRNKYSSSNFLGLELGEIFWHFVDILWVLLFLFFYFNR